MSEVGEKAGREEGKLGKLALMSNFNLKAEQREGAFKESLQSQAFDLNQSSQKRLGSSVDGKFQGGPSSLSAQILSMHAGYNWQSKDKVISAENLFSPR